MSKPSSSSSTNDSVTIRVIPSEVCLFIIFWYVFPVSTPLLCTKISSTSYQKSRPILSPCALKLSVCLYLKFATRRKLLPSGTHADFAFSKLCVSRPYSLILKYRKEYLERVQNSRHCGNLKFFSSYIHNHCSPTQPSLLHQFLWLLC